MTIKDNNLGFLLLCFKNCMSSDSLFLLVLLLNFLSLVIEALFHVFMTVGFLWQLKKGCVCVGGAR